MIAMNIGYVYLFSTIVLTITSQMIMRWQVNAVGAMPEELAQKLIYIAQLLIKPWVILAIAASFLSGIAWLLTLTKFEISFAYPWLAVNFVLVMLLGYFLFDESINLQKVLATTLIIAGVFFVG